MTKSRNTKRTFNPFAFVDNLRPRWTAASRGIEHQYRQYTETQQQFLSIAAVNQLQSHVVKQAQQLLSMLALVLQRQLANVVSLSKVTSQYNRECQINRCCPALTFHLVVLVNQHISNLLDINDLQIKLNSCYLKFYSWESSLRNMI